MGLKRLSVVLSISCLLAASLADRALAAPMLDDAQYSTRLFTDFVDREQFFQPDPVSDSEMSAEDLNGADVFTTSGRRPT